MVARSTSRFFTYLLPCPCLGRFKVGVAFDVNKRRQQVIPNGVAVNEADAKVFGFEEKVSMSKLERALQKGLYLWHKPLEHGDGKTEWYSLGGWEAALRLARLNVEIWREGGAVVSSEHTLSDLIPPPVVRCSPPTPKRDTPFAPPAGYVNVDGNWLNGNLLHSWACELFFLRNRQNVTYVERTESIPEQPFDPGITYYYVHMNRDTREVRGPWWKMADITSARVGANILSCSKLDNSELVLKFYMNSDHEENCRDDHAALLALRRYRDVLEGLYRDFGQNAKAA